MLPILFPSWTQKPPGAVAVNPADPLAEGLAACWLFASEELTLIRDIWGIFDATINLGTITPILDGFAGSGMVSTATASATAGVTIANSALLAFAGPHIAIDAWIIHDGSDTYGSLLSQQNTAGLFVKSTNIMVWGGFGADVNSTASSVPTGRLLHLGAGGDGAGNVRFYVDGKLDQAVGVTQPTNTITVSTMFDDTSSETFIGKVFVLRLWHRILTAQDFWDLYWEPWRMFAPPLSPLILQEQPATRRRFLFFS